MPQHYHEEIVGRGEAAQRLRGGLWSEKLEIDWVPFWNHGVVGRGLDFFQRCELDVRRRNCILKMRGRHHVVRDVERRLNLFLQIIDGISIHFILRDIWMYHIDKQAQSRRNDDMCVMSFHFKIRFAKL